MTFKIGGKDFYDYVIYRLKKDKLGFYPCQKFEAKTDTKTFISAPIPKCALDFLIFAHELGHCKSKQIPVNSIDSIDYFPSYSYISEKTLLNEYNAWVWALKYIRRLNLKINLEKVSNLIQETFGSYTRNSNVNLANTFIISLNEKFNLSLKLENDNADIYYIREKLSLNFDPYINDPIIKNENEKEKPIVVDSKRKSWMDIVDTQNKRYRKHAGKWY
ncbi:hypothetical protein [Acinetobacter sp.]|uniref:hypothetical protein n=1 Tax=Acinetobacter sp. TaxID=472 RepID=UPI00388E918B